MASAPACATRGQHPVMGLRDAARERNHLRAGGLHHRPGLLIQRRRGGLQVQVVVQGPVVFGLAERKAIGPKLRLQGLHVLAGGVHEEVSRDIVMQLLICRRCILAGLLQLPQQLTPDSAPVIIWAAIAGSSLAKYSASAAVLCQAEIHQHAPVRRMAGAHAGSQLRLRRGEVGRHGARSGDDMLPLRLGARGRRSGRFHALDLPVDSAQRLIHVGVERVLLMALHFMLMQQEIDLRQATSAVDAPPRRQSSRLGLARTALRSSRRC